MASFSSSLRGGRKRKFKSEINVVPYIDVMLVLLIIFMVVPPANSPSVINLPSAEKSSLPPDDYIQIVLKPNASLSIGVNGKNSAAPEELANRAAVLRRLRTLHGEHPEYPVMIAGDRESKYDDVIQLISEAKKMGINRVGLATK
ncbi:ExbD/TolR family protein [Massilia sp. P8910]|uniref:ExbD/TolR family protein n=1 Tax=Massilia antarctica TaxID=2765360 RepID=A0AA49A8A0_9BURK|nr:MULTISPECIES: ExbD/TolR family protein [Massilia]CUI04285.1 Tol biopolymer transport system, TolR protein [Janthinobacterium sp. CG23_2]MCE3606623.1 ExbD/TolR family protein [Massilia antarctica]MCY0913975.1 ExbD/TolR family protein [Massilia sp. H27-R4]QPI49637.1 ExbD/TolR family protein [Massilia antarctica]CUU28071.1 Tol biopolymer transport system, TolR protein [Janthinobacterium sp. CG23_2]